MGFYPIDAGGFPMPELDIAVSPSAEQIRRREFATIRRGYDPDQVRDYLYSVAEQLERIERELREAESSTTHRAQAPTPAPLAQPSSDPYEVFAKKVAGLLGTADKEAERLVEEAKGDSTRIIEEARSEADRIRTDAQASAEAARAEGERMLEAARIEAERALSGLAGRRQVLMDQLQTMQSRLLAAAKDLDVTIENPPADLPNAIAEVEAKAEAEAGSGGKAAADFVDPAYEDLWVSGDVGDLSDLASIQFDFDQDDASPDPED
jgi:DivIVA domain-containing protein